MTCIHSSNAESMRVFEQPKQCISRLNVSMHCISGLKETAFVSVGLLVQMHYVSIPIKIIQCRLHLLVAATTHTYILLEGP